MTGTEVLTGRVSDRNGSWLAEQLRLLGVDVGQIIVVGDRPDDLRSALEFLATGNDLLLTTGGLGPTADDLTADVVAQFQGRPARLDPELEQRITAIVERLSRRFGGLRNPESTAIATRKQAMVPAGASVIEPTGTAPGLVVPVAEGRTGPPVIVLPGPPWELQRMWPAAVEVPAVRAVLAGASELRQRTLRLWGVPESELAATLRRVDHELTGLELTTCLGGGELEIVSRYAPSAEAAQQRLVAAVRADFPDQLFSDGPTVDELIVTALKDRRWTAAVAEAATGGGLCARLAGAPLLGGLVGHTESALITVIGVPADLITGYGPVSPQVAGAMAEGARTVFGADVGIAITALSTQAESLGTVHLSVVTPDGEFARSLPGIGTATELQRERATPLVLHLLRQALTGQPPS
ncbi:MAG TPA: molybdopterin-binding protein [Kineosporiaceae bacterium]|nr:molybdopterin-binding protein [Kineosporiaceae bacterium]